MDNSSSIRYLVAPYVLQKAPLIERLSHSIQSE